MLRISAYGEGVARRRVSVSAAQRTNTAFERAHRIVLTHKGKRFSCMARIMLWKRHEQRRSAGRQLPGPRQCKQERQRFMTTDSQARRAANEVPMFLKQNQISKKCSQWIPKFRSRRSLLLLIVPVGACISATDPWSPTTNDTPQALTGRDVPSSWEMAANGQFTWNPTVAANAQAKAQKHIAVSPDGAFYLHAEGKSSSKLFVSPLELNDDMVTSLDDVDFGDFGATGRKSLNAKLDSNLQPAEKYTLGGLGAVSFDPRHGLGPIRVAKETDCESSADAAAIHSPNGPYDCYRMLVYSQIRDTSETPQQYHIAIAPMHLTLSRATHTIVKAAFSDNFKRILQSDGKYVKARQNSKDEFSDHFSATADGRLLVYDTAPRYTWSADPLATVEPSPSVKFEIPASFWSVTDAERSRLVRLSYPVSTTACAEAGDDCTRFDQAYPVFRNEYRFVDGTKIASTGAGCGYPWITPDGTDLFCNAGDIAALAMIGQSTRGTFQHIDARVQTTQQRYCQKTEADASCSELPPDAGIDACSPRGTSDHGCGGDAGTTLGTQRVTAIGAATGPWKIRGPGGHTTRFPLMHRAPSLMMMSRNTAMKAFADEPDARDDSFLYFEVATEMATDPDFVAFFHLNEAIVPITSSPSAPSSWEGRAPFGDTNPAEGARATRTADAAGHGYVGTLNECAQFPFDRWNRVEHPTAAPPNPGFLGRAVYFALPMGKVEFTAHGPYDRLREARTTMTLELAVRARNLDGNTGKTVLVAAKDSFELSFDPSDEDSVTFAAMGASAARFPNVSIDAANKYFHLAVTYQSGPGMNQATVGLYVDGAFAGNALVTGAGSLAIPTGPYPLCIGPGCGSSTSCSANTDPSRPELLIDEVGISSVIRSNEYIAAAALETGPTDVFSPNDPPAWFDPLPEGLDANDIRIPNTILDVADAAADPQEQFHRVAELGKALFKDDVLTVDKPDCGGRTPGHACSTCHDPDNFFAHPDAGFDKDIHDAALDTNTPSLIGRAFSTRQLKDRSEASLLHQAARVIEDPREMGGKLARIVGCLNRGDPLEGAAVDAAPDGIATYKQWFGYAYPGTTSVTKERLLGAIATYELRLNSGKSAVDLMLLTDAGIPTSDAGSVELGFRLFQGKGRCAGCHAGSNFTDELRHVTSVGGKAIKTPSLRNVSRTPPYFHDATKADLKAVIENYNRCGAVDPNGACAPELVALGLTVDEINALIAFLEGLDGTSP